MILYEALKPFFHILKVTSGFVAKTLIATKKDILLQLFPFWGLFLPWGTLKRTSNHNMIWKWEFGFFGLLMAFFRLFGVFYSISFVSFERVCRSSQMAEKLRIWHLCSFYYYLLTAIKILWKFSQPSCDGSHYKQILGYFLFPELSLWKRSIAVRRACVSIFPHVVDNF